ncbi:hypothetical protein ACQJBY_068874 [Aegilops geniculata]
MEFLIQPIESRTLLEEVNDSGMPLHYQVMPSPGGQLPATTASSADAQIYWNFLVRENPRFIRSSLVATRQPTTG